MGLEEASSASKIRAHPRGRVAPKIIAGKPGPGDAERPAGCQISTEISMERAGTSSAAMASGQNGVSGQDGASGRHEASTGVASSQHGQRPWESLDEGASMQSERSTGRADTVTRNADILDAVTRLPEARGEVCGQAHGPTSGITLGPTVGVSSVPNTVSQEAAAAGLADLSSERAGMAGSGTEARAAGDTVPTARPRAHPRGHIAPKIGRSKPTSAGQPPAPHIF